MSVIRSQCSGEHEYMQALRDDFAAKALRIAWAIERKVPTYGNDPSYRGAAERAYLMANAMLAARAQTDQH